VEGDQSKKKKNYLEKFSLRDWSVKSFFRLSATALIPLPVRRLLNFVREINVINKHYDWKLRSRTLSDVKLLIVPARNTAPESEILLDLLNKYQLFVGDLLIRKIYYELFQWEIFFNPAWRLSNPTSDIFLQLNIDNKLHIFVTP